jgi:hypothetical protein
LATFLVPLNLSQGCHRTRDPVGVVTKIFCANSADFELNIGILTGHNVMMYFEDGGIKWNMGRMHLYVPDDEA